MQKVLLLTLGMLACCSGARPTAPAAAGGGEAVHPGRTLQQAVPITADVVVVGAGAAGLAAARQLLDEQKGSVIVLEARSRVGGRCWSSTLATASGGNVTVDLGAGWIHGQTDNVLVTLAQQAGVELPATTTNYENSVLYLADGREATDAEEAAWEAKFEALVDAIADAQEGADSDTGINSIVQAALDAETGLNKQALAHLVNTNCEHEYAAGTSELSLFFDQDGGTQSGGDVFITAGFQRLPEHLAKGVDVRLGQKVTRVEAPSPSTALVSVTAVDSTGTTTVYSARRVIVALPLGVLKAGSVDFSPPLPSTNTAALGRLGSGLLNKLVMVFPSVFWGSPSVEVINRIDDAMQGAWSETYSLQPVIGQPVLVAFNAASHARALENKTDEQVKDEFMATIRKLFPDAPEPVSYSVTAWGKDPYSLGSYSFTQSAPGGDFAKVHTDTAEPYADDRIFFAGEHTRADHPATVHGAVLSGRKAATDMARALAGT